MTYEPTAANLAVELTRRSVESARPDAPVVPDERIRSARVATRPAAGGRQPAHRRPLGRAQPGQGEPAQLSDAASLGRPGILGLLWPR